MNANELLEDFAVDPKLVIELFVVFARFEFALKEAGYVFDQKGHAAPNWKTFKNDLAETFSVASISESEAIDWLTKCPPLRQCLSKEGRLEWTKMTIDRGSVTGAIDAACQVRNNLFHGAKFLPHSSRERDEQLIRYALDLLRACLIRVLPR